MFNPMLISWLDAVQELSCASRVRLPDAVGDVARSESVLEALVRINSGLTAGHGTGDLYLGHRSEAIGPVGNWHSYLLRVPSLSDKISTAAVHSVIHVLETERPLEVIAYRVKGFPIEMDLPEQPYLQANGRFVVGVGDWFTIPPGPTAVRLIGDTRNATFLRFTTDSRTSLTMTFEDENSRAPLFAFGDSKATGDYFFADMLGRFLRDQEGQQAVRFGETDIASIRCFLEFALATPLHAVTQWRLIQIAGRIHPRFARSKLRDLALSDLPNASKAASLALSRIGGSI